MMRILALTLALWGMSAAALAEATVQRYFPEVKGYRFSPLAAPEQLNLTQEVLNEFILASYSRWKVVVPGNTALDMEVYEMRDSLGAFGLYSLWSPGTPEGTRRLRLPVENELQDNNLIFWRGNYFFHISGSGEESQEEQLQELAGKLAETIPLINLYPVTVVHLPEEELVSGSTEYYLGQNSLSLNKRFPRRLVSEVGFDVAIEVAFGEYGPERYPLFLIGYPTPALAAQYAVNIQDKLQSYFTSEGIYMKRSGVIISLFLGPEEQAQSILNRVQYTPTIKWIYRKEPELEKNPEELVTFFGIIRTSLIGAFVFLGLTVCAGLTAGLIRYRVLEAFPRFSRRDEMIRLKISE